MSDEQMLDTQPGPPTVLGFLTNLLQQWDTFVIQVNKGRRTDFIKLSEIQDDMTILKFLKSQLNQLENQYKYLESLNVEADGTDTE